MANLTKERLTPENPLFTALQAATILVQKNFGHQNSGESRQLVTNRLSIIGRI